MTDSPHRILIQMLRHTRSAYQVVYAHQELPAEFLRLFEISNSLVTFNLILCHEGCWEFGHFVSSQSVISSMQSPAGNSHERKLKILSFFLFVGTFIVIDF